MSSRPRLEVHKFGGTSVGDAARIADVAAILDEAAGSARIVAIASAMSGVTDALVEAAARAAAGLGEEALGAVDDLRRRHLDTLRALGTGDDVEVAAEIERLVREAGDLLRAVLHLGELTGRSRDRLLAAGEKLSVRLLAAALRARGRAAAAVDADGFLQTDGRFGEADPVVAAGDPAVLGALGPLLERDAVPVVTGYCGRAPDGATVTLGRGGSDLSATVLGAALAADEVTIWTDVDGVYSADPRIVPDARVLEHLHFREAAEMSYYGAKVLHPRSMIPVADPGIPVRIRNAFRPSAPGTRVDARFSPGSLPVKAVTAVRRQALVSVEGKGMSGVPGVAARLFGALAQHGISVTMISQSSSESTICLAVAAEDAASAETALKRAFMTDLSRGAVEEIAVRRAVGLVAAVGLGMAHTPGIAARLFGALGRRRINVVAIAQGSSELNVSLAIAEGDVDAAVRAIHDEFGLHRIDTGEDSSTGLDLVLLGFGKIGRALVRLVGERERHVVERFGLEPRIVAIADRSAFLFRPAGLTPSVIRDAAAAKESGRGLGTLPGAVALERPADLVRHVLQYRLRRPVLIDVTDAGGTVEAFLEAFGRRCDVVTANKKPLAGDHAVFRALLDRAAESGRILKAEATVGAGLPVIDTLEMLLATGDRPTSAEGCLSGTLGFVTSRLEDGAPLSEAVAEAIAAGYTEPDPVADLSGADVARKAIILGRFTGLAGAGADVRLEGLVDPALAGLDRDALLARLRDEYDRPIAERVRSAAEDGGRLRYVARVAAGTIEVGPRVVPVDSPLATLRGTDNMIVFSSERYRDRPLVVRGPGAGVEVTAMGVLGDVLRIAAERR